MSAFFPGTQCPLPRARWSGHCVPGKNALIGQHYFSSIESHLMQVISSVRYNTTSAEKMAPRDILSSGRPSILSHQDWRLPIRVLSILRHLTSIEPELPKGFHIWPLQCTLLIQASNVVLVAVVYGQAPTGSRRFNPEISRMVFCNIPQFFGTG